jgi:hypothetical protein
MRKKEGRFQAARAVALAGGNSGMMLPASH